MRKLGIGKIRGLQQITTSKGAFIICAIDHRGSIKSMIAPDAPEDVTYQDVVERKQELCSSLAPYASAILLDPEYGAAQCIATENLPGSTGLLASIEATGYEDTPKGRITHLLDGWGVEKIKRMGASAVKILIYYRPDLPDVAMRQLNTIRLVAEDCIKFDIPFLVEPVTYPVKSGPKTAPEFVELRSCLVIETARQITKLPIDVLKAEFPADLSYQKDEGKALDLCRELDAASQVPWTILSAGVDYKTFAKQVEIACKAGASGFLGGRAVWQEAVKIKDKAERLKLLSTMAVDRIKELADITSKHASPWYRKFGAKPDELASIQQNWYKNY